MVIEYFYSLSSPFTYLGHGAFTDMAKAHGESIRHRPTDFRQVFSQTGGQPLPQRHPTRQHYRLIEMQRWAHRRGLPLVLEPAHHFGARELPSGLVIAAQQQGHDPAALAGSILRACWVEERDIASPDILTSLLKAVGLDAGLLQAALSDDVQAEYRRNTEEAIQRGIFGAPTYIVDGEMFWGQDRLDFVEEALNRKNQTSKIQTGEK